MAEPVLIVGIFITLILVMNGVDLLFYLLRKVWLQRKQAERTRKKDNSDEPALTTKSNDKGPELPPRRPLKTNSILVDRRNGSIKHEPRSDMHEEAPELPPRMPMKSVSALKKKTDDSDKPASSRVPRDGEPGLPPRVPRQSTEVENGAKLERERSKVDLPTNGNLQDKPSVQMRRRTGEPEVILPDGFSGTSVGVKYFPDYVKSTMDTTYDKFDDEDPKQPFIKEYKSISEERLYPPTRALTVFKESEKKRHRHKDILPYDYNRVVLSLLPSDPMSDFINASHVLALDPTMKFIAAMGPIPTTVDDFWRMIWEQNVHLVVMVTNTKEDDTVKCEQYWPDESSSTYGEINVEIQSSHIRAILALRRFIITKGNERRELTHLQYLDWHDYCAPSDPTAILTFRRKMRSLMDPKSPTLVHCSAGVGRTATIIAIDALIEYAEKHDSVNVYGLVERLRHQRIYMVQRLVQYQFIHVALARHFAVGNTFAPKSAFSEYYKSLLVDGNKKLLEQFRMLKEFEVKPILYYVRPEQLVNFRDPNILPDKDCYDIYYPKRGGNVPINAIHVDGYRRKKEYIVAQIPLPAEEPLLDFWQMVTETETESIVYLYNANEGEDLPQCMPTADRALPIRGFKVVLENTDKYDSYTVSDMELIAEDGKKRELRVFEVTVGMGELLDVKQLYQVYEDIAKIRSRSTTPFIVACMNGALYSGQFIACSNLFDMASVDDEIDVYLTANTIRSNRPEFIDSFEQYKSLYDRVHAFLKMDKI